MKILIPIAIIISVLMISITPTFAEEPFHPIIPPDKHFEGAVEGEGWYLVIRAEYSEPKYEYAPTRDLDELLKGLTTAN